MVGVRNPFSSFLAISLELKVVVVIKNLNFRLSEFNSFIIGMILFTSPILAA